MELGLNSVICKKIVDFHKGSIRYDNVNGAVSTFFLTFPNL
jgi:light-regulated signal transduction histidine kinase (bacteriophytochrome)